MCGAGRWVALFGLALAMGCERPNPAFEAARIDGPPETAVRPEASDAPVPDPAPADGGVPDVAAAIDTVDLPPAEATSAARSVQVTAGGMTTPYGGTGGDLFVDDCATAGEVAVGYAGYKETYVVAPGEYLIALQVTCARLEIPVGSSAVRVVAQRNGTLRGDSRGTSWRTQCPQDQVIVGYTGQIDDSGQTENLRLHCAPLNVGPWPPGSIVPGTVTMLPWVAAPVALPEVSASCPTGEVGRGHVVRVGSWIDAFHLTCAVLSAPP